jgi:hypothetical protein
MIQIFIQVSFILNRFNTDKKRFKRTDRLTRNLIDSVKLVLNSIKSISKTI